MSRKSGKAHKAEEQRSPSDLPLLPRDIFDEEIKTYLDKLSDEQWDSVESGDFEQGVVGILSEMMETLFDKFVQTLAQEQSRIDSGGHYFSGSTGKIIGRPLQDEGSSCSAAQASLEDIFHSCFGKALGIVQPNYFSTENLIKLFIGVIEWRKCMSPTPTTWSSFQRSLRPDSPTADSLIMMTYNVIYLLRKCLQTRAKLKEYRESEEESNKSEDNCTDDIEFTPAARRVKCETAFFQLESSETASPKSESSETASPKSEGSETASPKSEGSETASPKSEDSETGSFKSESSEKVLSPKAFLEQLYSMPDSEKITERTFIAEFLIALIKYVSFKAHKNPRDVDFFRIFLRLTKLTEGKLHHRLPNHVCPIIQKVYRQLLKRYGSKHAIYVMMECRQSRFEDILAKILIEKVNELNWWEKVKISFKKKKDTYDKSTTLSSVIMRSLRSLVGRVRNRICCTVVIEFKR